MTDRLVFIGCCALACFAAGVVVAQRPQQEIPLCRPNPPMPPRTVVDCSTEAKWICSTQDRMGKVRKVT